MSIDFKRLLVQMSFDLLEALSDHRTAFWLPDIYGAAVVGRYMSVRDNWSVDRINSVDQESLLKMLHSQSLVSWCRWAHEIEGFP